MIRLYDLWIVIPPQSQGWAIPPRSWSWCMRLISMFLLWSLDFVTFSSGVFSLKGQAQVSRWCTLCPARLRHWTIKYHQRVSVRKDRFWWWFVHVTGFVWPLIVHGVCFPSRTSYKAFFGYLLGILGFFQCSRAVLRAPETPSEVAS